MDGTVVILAAGRATRLGGRSKLLVEAAGVMVADWHRAAIGRHQAVAVVRPEHVDAVRDYAPWLAVVGHGQIDGPGGALRAYLAAERDDSPLIVQFADTLLLAIPDEPGDWVGVAPGPWRVWDYTDRITGQFVRGTPRVLVHCGVYQFTDRSLLAAVLDELADLTDGEIPMASVLARYQLRKPVREVLVDGWQDAGDEEALARVKPVHRHPCKCSTTGTSARWETTMLVPGDETR